MKYTSGEIWKLSITYGLALCAPNIIWAVVLYQRHPEFRQKYCIEMNHWKSLLGKGSQFFLIQLAVMILFLTDKILITQIFGPEYVTQYDVVFKIFSIVTLATTLILTPLWSADTEAHHCKDYLWIVKMLKRQIIIYMGVIVVTVILAFMTRPIVKILIGTDFEG